MKSLVTLVALAGLGFFGLCAFGVRGAADEKPALAVKWEYKTESINGTPDFTHEKILNKLGEEGWEIVGFHTRDEQPPRGAVTKYVFKRPKR
jgi:hypothetical protein